jgi:probable selenium-dependent hydroxylase accessory protein YqeC
MWHFHRIDPLELLSDAKYPSFVGAGGKTTLIEYLGREAARTGKTVAVTTTTKIYGTPPYVLFENISLPPSSDHRIRDGFVRIGKYRKGEKLTGLSFDDVRLLGDLFDLVLIEADGAKRYPLKCPATHEPVIPPFSDKIFVVAGLDALHQTVEASVFRWELARDMAGISGDVSVTTNVFSDFFSSSMLLKDVDLAKCTVILNKYDVLKERHEAMAVAGKILEKTGVAEAIISSPLHRLFYRLTGASSTIRPIPDFASARAPSSPVEITNLKTYK